MTTLKYFKLMHDSLLMQQTNSHDKESISSSCLLEVENANGGVPMTHVI